MNKLFDKARMAYESLQQALKWVAESEDFEISANQSLLKSLKYAIYKTKNLRDAAIARMCVGVYGASQSGKSYMVSMIACKKDGQLIAQMGGYAVDFIKYINPPGGQESTGLVTRFTTKIQPTPNGYPIRVSLLSELDLVKLIFNSYASDILPLEDDDASKHQEEVEAVLLSFDKVRATQPNSLSIEDVFDLEDYCTSSKFASNVRIQSIKKTRYWGRLADLLPNLDLAERLRLYQVLWQKLEIYDDLFHKLATELEKLGHPRELHCAAKALFVASGNSFSRPEKSIIDVTSLEGLGHARDHVIDVYTDASKIFTVDVATLSALVSELVIPLKDNPHALFETTDLLDFPGARSRKGHPKNEQVLADPKIRVENFLRGKVSYLFDKYCSKHELSTMLLCVGPSNQEVVGLDRLIDDWVAKTHGAKSENRDKLTAALFVVLTKFDQEFALDAGRGIDGDRWSTRLQASLIRPFGAHAHHTNWVAKWDSRGSFRNVYWLRNPNADQSGLIDYQGDAGRSPEVGVTAAKKDIVAKLRQAFLENALVKVHFSEPRNAWDAGMSLNDGGASYLITNLAPACNPEVKLNQINQGIDEIIKKSHSDLKKYYVSSNLDELFKEKQDLARALLSSGAVMMQRQKLGEFISNLLTSDSDTVTLFNNASLEFERQSTSKRPGLTSSLIGLEIEDELAAALGLVIEKPHTENIEEPSSKSLKLSDKFILDFLQAWRLKAIDACTSSNASDYLHLDKDLLLKLLTEFEIAARRTGLVTELKKFVEESSQYRGGDRKNWVWRQTSGVTVRFNEFLCHGGIPIGGHRPAFVKTIDGREVPIFGYIDEDPQDLKLPDIGVDHSKSYFVDWLQALQASVCTNAEFQGGTVVDVHANRTLGSVLHSFTETIAHPYQ